MKQRVEKIIQKVKQQEGKSYLDKSENLKNKYKCTKCKDMMFIELEDGSFGSCECRKIRIAEDKLKASGVSEEFRKKRFENFNYENSIESMEAYVKTKNYSKNFNIIKLSNNNSIMLLGQVGSGKTHLAMAVSNIMLDNSIGVIYMPYRSVITRIKQSVTDEENYQKEVNIYKNAEVLLIDDLFKGRITEADINIIYEIVDYRYFKNLPMIITTEKTIEDLVEIDEAIGSRLYEKSKNYIIEMKGKKLNYRIYGD
ncbi:ATP-binding protein [Paraclostridium bifermentans]|uniref:ATP-binding protein n=1 Tax=Paraclostridium bifermentans TaxID=1490 RepID=UPI00359C7987